MKTFARTSIPLVLALALAPSVAAQWKPVEGRIMSRWAAEVSPETPLPEYPRPQLRRDDWTNLNGLWDYAITARSVAEHLDGKVVVTMANALERVDDEFVPLIPPRGSVAASVPTTSPRQTPRRSRPRKRGRRSATRWSV